MRRPSRDRHALRGDMAALAQALRAGTLPLTKRIGSLAAALQAAVRQCIGAPASAQPLHGTVRP